MSLITLTVGQERALSQITNALQGINDSLEALSKTLDRIEEQSLHKREDITDCKSFEMWAGELSYEDRAELMNELYHSKRWHYTCVAHKEDSNEDLLQD